MAERARTTRTAHEEHAGSEAFIAILCLLSGATWVVLVLYVLKPE